MNVASSEPLLRLLLGRERDRDQVLRAAERLSSPGNIFAMNAFCVVSAGPSVAPQTVQPLARAAVAPVDRERLLERSARGVARLREVKGVREQDEARRGGPEPAERLREEDRVGDRPRIEAHPEVSVGA